MGIDARGAVLLGGNLRDFGFVGGCVQRTLRLVQLSGAFHAPYRFC